VSGDLFQRVSGKALDEYGVPIPLGKKLEFLVREIFTLDDAVDSVRQYFPH
jgi:hypothetical protein